MNLLLCDPEEVYPDNTAVVRGDRAEHLRKILKAAPGDSVSAGIAGRGKGSAEILELTPGYCLLRLKLSGQPESLYPLRLAVGMVRPIQVKRILKTAACFGIEEIIFVPTSLGEASYREAKIWQEYHRFLLEGASQGGISSIPRVSRTSGLKELFTRINPDERRILFDLPKPSRGSGPLFAGEKALVLIGSERGWTEKEREQIYNAEFECRSLGERILTTETACTAATVLILRELGIFSSP